MKNEEKPKMEYEVSVTSECTSTVYIVAHSEEEALSKAQERGSVDETDHPHFHHWSGAEVTDSSPTTAKVTP